MFFEVWDEIRHFATFEHMIAVTANSGIVNADAIHDEARAVVAPNHGLRKVPLLVIVPSAPAVGYVSRNGTAVRKAKSKNIWKSAPEALRRGSDLHYQFPLAES